MPPPPQLKNYTTDVKVMLEERIKRLKTKHRNEIRALESRCASLEWARGIVWRLSALERAKTDATEEVRKHVFDAAVDDSLDSAGAAELQHAPAVSKRRQPRRLCKRNV